MAKFYITTPIFYPNAKLHMGHAYTTTLADILARYHRLSGDETYLLTGSDENTQKLVEAALKEGKPVGEFLDDIIAGFTNLFAQLDISYDQFIRTSDTNVHWPGAVALWKKLESAGDIYKKKYEGFYCVGHEAFVTEKDLVDGKCPDHGTEPQRISEENYFFRLSKHTGVIKEKILSGELEILPVGRRNEILSLLEEGLEDVSFSRPKNSAGIGVPVPGDELQVMYVWCDALANYLSALGFGREDDSLFKKFWPADVHVIGKDILRFHAAIWPGMLLSAGLPLPRRLLVHGFITSGGKKMSKTLGNVIDPLELLAEYGTDAVRYYLARHISPFDDGDLTAQGFKDVYNGELANGLGNLAARIMTLAEMHLSAPIEQTEHADFPDAYTKAMDAYEINRALDYVWSEIQKLDQKITATEPFKLVKSDAEKGRALIAELVAELYLVVRLLTPFMPDTNKKLKEAIFANKKPENLFPRKD